MANKQVTIVIINGVGVVVRVVIRLLVDIVELIFNKDETDDQMWLTIVVKMRMLIVRHMATMVGGDIKVVAAVVSHNQSGYKMQHEWWSKWR